MLINRVRPLFLSRTRLSSLLQTVQEQPYIPTFLAQPSQTQQPLTSQSSSHKTVDKFHRDIAAHCGSYTDSESFERLLSVLAKNDFDALEKDKWKLLGGWFMHFYGDIIRHRMQINIRRIQELREQRESEEYRCCVSSNDGLIFSVVEDRISGTVPICKLLDKNEMQLLERARLESTTKVKSSSLVSVGLGT